MPRGKRQADRAGVSSMYDERRGAPTCDSDEEAGPSTAMPLAMWVRNRHPPLERIAARRAVLLSFGFVHFVHVTALCHYV